MCAEGAQLELQRERCVRMALNLSSEVDECKPLPRGEQPDGHGGQGLTLVHFSAERKHILWNTLGA
jgi:hypothetical protein